MSYHIVTYHQLWLRPHHVLQPRKISFPSRVCGSTKKSNKPFPSLLLLLEIFFLLLPVKHTLLSVSLNPLVQFVLKQQFIIIQHHATILLKGQRRKPYYQKIIFPKFRNVLLWNAQSQNQILNIFKAKSKTLCQLGMQASQPEAPQYTTMSLYGIRNGWIHNSISAHQQLF